LSFGVDGDFWKNTRGETRGEEKKYFDRQSFTDNEKTVWRNIFLEEEGKLFIFFL
jgi:hypothetical protein